MRVFVREEPRDCRRGAPAGLQTGCPRPTKHKTEFETTITYSVIGLCYTHAVFIHSHHTSAVSRSEGQRMGATLLMRFFCMNERIRKDKHFRGSVIDCSEFLHYRN